MAEVRISENETIDRALKRFKKECEKHGILAEVKKREFYEKPSVKRKRKRIAAIRKIKKRESKFNR